MKILLTLLITFLSFSVNADYIVYTQQKTAKIPEPPYIKGCHYNPEEGTLWKYDQDYNESNGCSYSCNSVFGGWYNENRMFAYYDNQEIANYKRRSDDDDRYYSKNKFDNVMVGNYQYTLTRGELKAQYMENASGGFRQDNLIKEWEVCFEATEEQPNQ